MQVLHTHGTQIKLLMGGLDETELRQLSGFMERLANHLDVIARQEQPPTDSGIVEKGKTRELKLSAGSQR